MHENFIMMANGDVYYFTWGNHETHLGNLMEQYSLSYTGRDGYGLINEHEICEEHDILVSHGNDTDSCRYGKDGLTPSQIASLKKEVVLGHLDSYFVKLLLEAIHEELSYR